LFLAIAGWAHPKYIEFECRPLADFSQCRLVAGVAAGANGLLAGLVQAHHLEADFA
jgi:hypothetical protein